VKRFFVTTAFFCGVGY